MNLEGVEKTMLLTLFAKAQHSQKKPQIFRSKSNRCNITNRLRFYHRRQGQVHEIWGNIQNNSA